MRLPFGFQVLRPRAATTGTAVPSTGGWWTLVREAFTGAWQRNTEWTLTDVTAYHAVFACITLIASDLGKLRPKLVERDENGIWTETDSPTFSRVLRRPNRYQNHIQFKEWWTISKLLRGNAYALKERDGRGGPETTRGAVRALYLLDPTKVKPLVAPDGEVLYQLGADALNGQETDGVVVPASEIVHDRINCLFHPLVGISPIYASGLAASIGLKIEENASAFFGNGSNPSGILTAPGSIPQPTAERLKAAWEANYSGDNSGKVAVLGDGLKFEPMRMSAADAQMLETLRWTAETVCSTFHVPAFKIGVGPTPTYQNGEILNQIYYSDCLQAHIESWELCVEEAIGLNGTSMGVELDLDGLLRMDTATQLDSLGKAIGGGFLSPNEARAKIDLPPVAGGDTPYLQQQNYSLAALDERDRNSPFDKPAPPPTPSPTPDNPPEPAPSEPDTTSEDAFVIDIRARKLRLAA